MTFSPASAAPPLSPAELGALPTGRDRYAPEGLLATGGMGEVFRVRDRQLNRVLAMKVIRNDRMGDPANVCRFVEEAQTTAQLQHPGIVPVHEIGLLADGRPWFTMREVQGHTLREHLIASQAGTDRARGLRWLVDVLLHASEAMAYAHARGVIHRDLKPENLLIGSFGEVWVVDWGLAKVVGAPDLAAEHLPIETIRTTDDRFSTRVGEVAGTPQYMAPEQWAGEVGAFGPPTDVYALGGILAEILTGVPRPDEDATCAAPELLAVARRALSGAPAARHADAGAFADELRSWLDGAARTAEALALFAAAVEPGAAATSLAAQARQLRERAENLTVTLDPLAPVEEKRTLWSLEDHIAEIERHRVLKEVEHVQLLQAALVRDPALREARRALADHYQRQHADAERLRDGAAAARYEALLRAHDVGDWAGWLAGTGTLTLHTNPPGARVDLLRFVERDRRLLPEHIKPLGYTPINGVEVPIGSYLLVIRSPGRPGIRYPVRIERQGAWHGIAPGQTAPEAIPLPSELAPGEVYVPPGWTTLGGDAGAIGSLPRRTVWVDGFFIRRFAVSAEEYCAFLDALDPDAAAAHADPEGYERIAGRWHARQGDEGYPALYLSWRDAASFADWTARRTGAAWRLATEAEWEKAARGVDERIFPWGDHLDPTFAAYQASHGPPGPRPVKLDAFPCDESPYGVRGMAGTSSDWVREPYLSSGHPLVDGSVSIDLTERKADVCRVQRGGTWGLAEQRVRVCTRWWQTPTHRNGMVGARLVRALRGDA